MARRAKRTRGWCEVCGRWGYLYPMACGGCLDGRRECVRCRPRHDDCGLFGEFGEPVPPPNATAEDPEGAHTVVRRGTTG